MNREQTRGIEDPIMAQATFRVTIAGQEYELHRRSTYIMAQIAGFDAVLGLLGGIKAADDGKVEIDGLDDSQCVYLELVQKTVSVALVSPKIVKGTASPPFSYHFEDLAHVADVLFKAFMGSGLSVDPS